LFQSRLTAAAILVALTGVAWAGSSVPAAAAALVRPSVVLVLTDDQRWDTLSAMPAVRQHLVDQGVTFTNGFVVNSLCCPSRASILTGRYSHSTGVYGNRPPFGGFGSFRDSATIATRLHGAGYRTAWFGKYLNGYGGRYVPPGWDRWIAFTSFGYYRYGLNVDGWVHRRGEHPEYSTDLLSAHAVSFIRSTPRPFFLVYAPFAPHAPATPALRHQDAFAGLSPPRFPSLNEANVGDKPTWLQSRPQFGTAGHERLQALMLGQLRSLVAVDEGVEAIVQALEETGRLSDTMIVFTSDNGLSWGEHRLLNWKSTAYEESIRVPFVVRYDPLVNGPREDGRQVLNIDLAPTFAELGGVRAATDGQSLLPLLSSPDAPWRDGFLIEHLAGPPFPVVPTYCALRDSRYTYVTYANGERELYDLVADPNQLENLAADPAQDSISAGLQLRLSRLCNPPPPGFSRRLLCSEGSPEADTIAGTPAYDVICAGGGDDVVDAGAGNDFVFLGAGDDRGSGGTGADVLYGSSGSDLLSGGPGDDRHHAADGRADRITCGAGRDVVFADGLDAVGRGCETLRR
jgi:arylsulfatase A-like enzyme